MLHDDEWLSLEEIAEELDIPLRTLYAQRSKRPGRRGTGSASTSVSAAATLKPGSRPRPTRGAAA